MRIHCLLRNPKKKGVTAIYFTVRYSGENVILFPCESIDTSMWINKNGVNKPKPSADNTALIGRLNRFEMLIRDTYDELQKDNTGLIAGDDLKKAVYEKKFPTELKGEIKETYKPVMISEFFQAMIDDTKNQKRLGQDGNGITKSTIATYLKTKNHFVDFENKQKKQYQLKNIDQKLIDGFTNYLSIDLKMAFNGSGKYMKTFRTMMNYARQKKLIGSDVLIDNKVRVTKETPDNIYLSENDIEDMMKIDTFDTTLYETVRDLFVIGCKTGLRFSDYSIIKNSNIDNGFMNIIQKKTGGKVTVPIHPIVEKILNKYPSGLPKCPPNQVFNRYLKEIGKKLPQLDKDFEKVLTRSGKPDSKIYKKWELLQTHTARRSFCTNEYLSGTPTITIMALSGHKSEKSFMSYIKADSLQHAMIVMDRWRNKEKDKREKAA